jgi:hypothetical protein
MEGGQQMPYVARTASVSPGLSLVGVLYVIAGVIVAASHHYLAHLHTAKTIGSALLAILLWPLLYLGISLHIH